MQTKTINGWEVKIGKQAKSGWLAIALRDGIELREQAETKAKTIKMIEIAIETEMTNPWWG